MWKTCKLKPDLPQVSVLAFSRSSTLLASAQAGPRSVGRLWDFPTGTCLCLFKTYLQSLVSLRWVSGPAGVCSAVQHSSFSLLFLCDKPGMNYSCLCLPPNLQLIPQVLLSPHPHNLSPFLPCGDKTQGTRRCFSPGLSCSFSHSGAVLCGVGKDVHSKTVRADAGAGRFP